MYNQANVSRKNMSTKQNRHVVFLLNRRQRFPDERPGQKFVY